MGGLHRIDVFVYQIPRPWGSLSELKGSVSFRQQAPPWTESPKPTQGGQWYPSHISHPTRHSSETPTVSCRRVNEETCEPGNHTTVVNPVFSTPTVRMQWTVPGRATLNAHPMPTLSVSCVPIGPCVRGSLREDRHYGVRTVSPLRIPGATVQRRVCAYLATAAQVLR